MPRKPTTRTSAPVPENAPPEPDVPVVQSVLDARRARQAQRIKDGLPNAKDVMFDIGTKPILGKE